MAGSATSDATGLDEGFVDNIPDYPVQQDAECSVSVHFRIRVVILGHFFYIQADKDLFAPGASSGSIWLTCRILPTNKLRHWSGVAVARPCRQTEGNYRLQKRGEIANPAVTDPFRWKKLSALGGIGQ